MYGQRGLHGSGEVIWDRLLGVVDVDRIGSPFNAHDGCRVFAGITRTVRISLKEVLEKL